jgi:hypothetical protein
VSAARIPLIDELSRTDRDIVAIQKEMDPEKRKRLINDFLIERDALFTRVARSQSRRYRVLSPNDIDDVIQVVRDIAVSMIDGKGYTPFAGMMFEVVLNTRSHTAIQLFVRNSSLSNLSGDVGARKRSVEWRGVVEELTQRLQRTPTQAEIQDRYRELYHVTENGTIDKTIKSGIVGNLGVSLTDPVVIHHIHSSGGSDESPENLVVSEAADIIEQLIQECASISDELAAYAKAWITAVVEDVPREEFHRSLGISRVRATQLDKELKNVMRDYIISH